jgi:hypothetical protein
MNYADYAYPVKNYIDTRTAEAHLDDWLDKVGSLFPADYVSAMLKTVHGVVRLKKLSNWLEKTSTKLEITIQSGPLTDDAGNLVHGTTKARGSDSFDPNAIDTIISLFDLPDRMQGWSDNEIINIVGVHESFHIRPQGKRIETIDGQGLFAKCHFLVIQEEFKARIEYSLVAPDKPVSKSNWLETYQRYFDIAWRLEKMLTDPTYKNTAYCDDIDKALMKDFETYHNEALAKAKVKKSNPLPGRRESLSSFESTARFAAYRQERELKDYFVEGINLTESLFYEAIDESYRFSQVFKLYVDPALKAKVEEIFNKKTEHSLENLD